MRQVHPSSEASSSYSEASSSYREARRFLQLPTRAYNCLFVEASSKLRQQTRQDPIPDFENTVQDTTYSPGKFRCVPCGETPEISAIPLSTPALCSREAHRTVQASSVVSPVARLPRLVPFSLDTCAVFT